MLNPVSSFTRQTLCLVPLTSCSLRCPVQPCLTIICQPHPSELFLHYRGHLEWLISCEVYDKKYKLFVIISTLCLFRKIYVFTFIRLIRAIFFLFPGVLRLKRTCAPSIGLQVQIMNTDTAKSCLLMFIRENLCVHFHSFNKSHFLFISRCSPIEENLCTKYWITSTDYEYRHCKIMSSKLPVIRACVTPSQLFKLKVHWIMSTDTANVCDMIYHVWDILCLLSY